MEYFVNGVTGLLFCGIAYTFLDLKLKQLIPLFFIVFINQLFVVPFSIFLNLLLVTCYISFLKIRIEEAFLVTLLAEVLILINASSNVYLYVCFSILFIAGNYGLYRVFANKHLFNVCLIEVIALCFLKLFTLLYDVYQSKIIDQQLILFMVILLVSICLLIYYLEIIIKESYHSKLLLKNQSYLDSKYVLNQTMNHNRKYHLLTLKSLIENQKLNEAIEYINSLEDEAEKVDIFFTGNDRFDYLINKHVKEIQFLNKTVSIICNINEQCYINDESYNDSIAEFLEYQKNCIIDANNPSYTLSIIQKGDIIIFDGIHLYAEGLEKKYLGEHRGNLLYMTLKLMK